MRTEIRIKKKDCRRFSRVKTPVSITFKIEKNLKKKANPEGMAFERIQKHLFRNAVPDRRR